LAKQVLEREWQHDQQDSIDGRNFMMDLNGIKVTPRDQQVLNLLVQGCSNKEIAGQLSISPRTVKQHLRTLFLRAGIRDGRKRVKLAIAAFENREVIQ
jgi:DNA-binding NarL/FixJ family response regulator